MKKRNLATALMILAGLLIPLLLCSGVLAVSGFSNPGETDRGTWIGITACFILPLLLFIVAAFAAGYTLLQQEKREALRQTVLRLAGQNDGRVTAHEVALSSSLTIEAAQAYLDRLAAQGVCEMEYSPNGVVCFVFQGVSRPVAAETS
ncbi:MAG: hypothetical protein M5U01_17300 [Ardenticatenaceae bacterium]|nr:hypothetical protein [Ardenticatenaceae bacterium]